VIERLTDMPPGTIGFRVAGDIEREDYDEVLVPQLRRALEAGGGRTLYLIEDLDEIEAGAPWADTRLGFDLSVRHHEAWIRSAIVTDIQLDGARDEAVRVDDPRRGARVAARRARASEDVGRARRVASKRPPFEGGPGRPRL
jgi:hypothetical protein